MIIFELVIVAYALIVAIIYWQNHGGRKNNTNSKKLPLTKSCGFTISIVDHSFASVVIADLYRRMIKHHATTNRNYVMKFIIAIEDYRLLFYDVALTFDFNYFLMF